MSVCSWTLIKGKSSFIFVENTAKLVEQELWFLPFAIEKMIPMTSQVIQSEYFLSVMNLTNVTVYSQRHPVDRVRSYHEFHSRWVQGEFHAYTLSESYKNESDQVCQHREAFNKNNTQKLIKKTLKVTKIKCV